MSIFSTSIRVGIGLVLGWGLTCLGYRLTRSQAWGEASSRLNKSSLTPGPQSRDREHNGLAPVRVVTQGQAGWARRRQERVKAVIGEETYRTLEALMCWCWGAEVEEVIGEVAVGRSGFYYRLEQALARLPQVFGDGRQHNGRQVAAMDSTVVGRIVEMVIGQPGITPEEVSQRLAQQDGSRVKAEEVADYLAQARLADYHGSPYRQAVLPVVKEAEDRFSRYAAHLLQVPALEQLGFYQVAPLLDVTGAQTYYSHLVRCHTVFLTLSSGKTRLYHTGELVEDEFARTLGEARYPQSSDLHAYFDRIVERDQAQAEQGVPEEERLVGRFVRQAQQVLARTIQPGAGRAIYLDPHVIALYTAKPIARTKHGIQQRVVKALVKLRVVSANQPGRPLAFLLGQGDLSFHACLEEAVDLTAWTTGEPVELVGVDRGALSQAILERFTERDIGLMVWSEDTPTLRRSLASVKRATFHDAEYETMRRADGCKVRRLKTRVADVPDMLINSQGYRCRTIVVEDVRSRHRIGIHAVGQPTRPLSACQILAFLRGKQWVEEDIKQGIAWGSDAFCGGEILPALRRARPNAEQVQALKAQARKLKERWQENLAEEGAAVAEWRAGQRTKRQLNDLLKGIRRRRRRIAADWQQAENLIRWGQTGVVPPSQVQWVVDTRKMLLMSQFQDFARLARQETMTLLQRFLKQAVIESAIVEQDGAVSIERQQSIEREAERMLERMPWGQLETRLFEQGGWVHKDSQQGVIHVTVKPFKNRLLQRACELLCEHLNRRQSLMRCQDGEYTLHYACRASPPP
jgi:hypothetical protein